MPQQTKAEKEAADKKAAEELEAEEKAQAEKAAADAKAKAEKEAADKKAAEASGDGSANVTNHYSGPLGLPGGPVIQPGKTVKVDKWNTIKDHNVVKGWLKAKVLTVE